MCVICASRSGVRQPSEDQLRAMFQANPHGAGYMTARDGKVEIKKGFMTWAAFADAINAEHFRATNPVVYHFRISTQAGTGPEMTHPFPLTNHIEACKFLTATVPMGVAHNGIIRLTSDSRDREYSDTAHFVAEFLAYLVRDPMDAANPAIRSAIERLAPGSKFALMDGDGTITTVGDWINARGLIYSNLYWSAPDLRLCGW